MKKDEDMSSIIKFQGISYDSKKNEWNFTRDELFLSVQVLYGNGMLLFRGKQIKCQLASFLKKEESFYLLSEEVLLVMYIKFIKFI